MTMKNFFRKLSAGMGRWMAGRYGYDELSAAVSVAALALLALSCVPKLRLLYFPAVLLCLWLLFRCFSRNLAKRQRERAAYLRFTGRIQARREVRRKAWQERKTHRYYRCKQCRTVLRVPRGKGKIKISCPKCHCEITKKT
jgi:hypothetical protein